MKHFPKAIATLACYACTSGTLLASNASQIDLYYESPVVMQNTKSKLVLNNQSGGQCKNSLGQNIPNNWSWETTRTRLGVGSSSITCNVNGKTVKKTAHYYVIHDGPAGVTSTLKDAGGGRHYGNIVNHESTQSCLNVRNLAQLQSCMSDPSVTMVFVPEDVTITVTANDSIVIEQGKTLASNRGYKGSAGATIAYVGSKTHTPAIRMKSKSRLTGFRVVGHTPPVKDTLFPPQGDETIGIAIGYIFTYDHANGHFNASSPYLNVSDVKVDNNEIYHWSNVAVRVGYSARDVEITHNFIHDNRGDEQGYGVLANGTDPDTQVYSSTFVYKNIFSLNRHDIASSGYVGNSYQALYNLVFDGARVANSNPGKYLFRFDIHGCKSRKYCDFQNGIATPTQTHDPRLPVHIEERGNDTGLTYYVVNNIFSLRNTNNQRAVQFNGKTKKLSAIGYNWMSHSRLMATGTAGNGFPEGAIEIRNYDTTTDPDKPEIVHSASGLKARNVNITGNDLQP